MEFGAFVEILPGKEGLCHISKLSRQRVSKVTDVLSEGQQIPVKLLEVDKQGRLNLSYIDAIEADKQFYEVKLQAKARGTDDSVGIDGLCH